jgi:hypothetical protein
LTERWFWWCASACGFFDCAVGTECNRFVRVRVADFFVVDVLCCVLLPRDLSARSCTIFDA